MCGALTVFEYQESQRGQSSFFHKYAIKSGLDGDCSYKYMGHVYLSVKNTRAVDSGMIHYLDSSGIHSKVNHGETLTLFLQGRRLSKNSSVYREKTIEETSLLRTVTRFSAQNVA